MQKPLVIARCEAGPELSAKLAAWESNGLSVAVISEAADAAFDALLPHATATLHALAPGAAGEPPRPEADRCRGVRQGAAPQARAEGRRRREHHRRRGGAPA